MRIAAEHPVRAAVAGLANYHDSVGYALLAVDRVCDNQGIDVNISDGPAFAGAEGRVNLRLRPDDGGYGICDRCEEEMDYDDVVVFSWDTMPSGRVEVTAYIS